MLSDRKLTQLDPLCFGSLFCIVFGIGNNPLVWLIVRVLFRYSCTTRNYFEMFEYQTLLWICNGEDRTEAVWLYDLWNIEHIQFLPINRHLYYKICSFCFKIFLSHQLHNIAMCIVSTITQMLLQLSVPLTATSSIRPRQDWPDPLLPTKSDITYPSFSRYKSHMQLKFRLA